MPSDAATLTFDDGPHPVWTPAMLDVLREHDARAVFFVLASEATRHPDIVAAVAEAGHEIGFHATRHLRHTRTSREEISEDTSRGLRELAAVGIEPRYWRPPWGVAAPWTHELAEEFGLGLVGWTADTHDWRGDTAVRMLDAIGPLIRPGVVVLMHDGLGPGALRSGCGETVALTAALIPAMRAAGLEPGALDALPALPPLRGVAAPGVRA